MYIHAYAHARMYTRKHDLVASGKNVLIEFVTMSRVRRMCDVWLTDSFVCSLQDCSLRSTAPL